MKSTLNTHIAWYKRWLSFLVPIKLQEWESANHAHLELFLQNNQLQLTYDHAIYSFGLSYKPFLCGFAALKKEDVVACQKVLLLGSGLGSIVQILQTHYPNANRQFTIVDIDSVILDLCSQHLAAEGIGNCIFVREDALAYMQRIDAEAYDLICVDIFKDVDVPTVFLKPAFIQQVYKGLNTGGIMVYNYIDNEVDNTQALRMSLQASFSDLKQTEIRKNILWLGHKK